MPAPFARLASACAAALMLLGGTAFVASQQQDSSEVAVSTPETFGHYIGGFSCRNDDWQTDVEVAICTFNPENCTNRALSRLQCRGDDSGAVDVLEVACESHDHAAACTSLGVLLNAGVEAPPDPDRAKRLHRRACEAGNDTACLNAAVLEAGGNPAADLPEVMAKGIERACKDGVAPACFWARDNRRGCRLGFAESCSWLAFSMEYDRSGDEDWLVARGLHAAACEAGMAPNCARLDELNRENPVSPEAYASIVSLFINYLNRMWRTPECRTGDAVGCYRDVGALAGALIEGAAVRTRRSTEVAQTLEPLCRPTAAERKPHRWEATFCERLGDIRARFPIEEGEGMSAIDAYRRACRGGLGVGCRKAAEAMSERPADERDADAIAALFTEGCDEQDGRSCLRLADDALATGDSETAASFAARACRSGTQGGCLMLAAQAGRPGFEPMPDRKRAMMFVQSCGDGLVQACDAATEVARKRRLRERDWLLALVGDCEAGDAESCAVLRSVRLSDL